MHKIHKRFVYVGKEGERRGIGLRGCTERISMASVIVFLKKPEANTICLNFDHRYTEVCHISLVLLCIYIFFLKIKKNRHFEDRHFPRILCNILHFTKLQSEHFGSPPGRSGHQ